MPENRKPPEEDGVYRVKHVTKSAWEQGPLPLPGLGETRPSAMPQLAKNVEDVTIELAMTGEIPIAVILEALSKEKKVFSKEEALSKEEVSKEIKTEEAKDEKKDERRVKEANEIKDFWSKMPGQGPIRPEDIEAREPAPVPEPKPKAEKSKKARQAKKRAAMAKKRPAKAAEPARAVPEFAKELTPETPKPKADPAKVEAAKAEMLAQARKAKEKELLAKKLEPKPEKIQKQKPEKIQQPKPEKVQKPKPEKVQKTKPEKTQKPKPEKIQQPKPEKMQKQKPEMRETIPTGPMVRGDDWVARFSGFWEDDAALYHVPVARILRTAYRSLYFFGLRTVRPAQRVLRHAKPLFTQPARALWHLLRSFVLTVRHLTTGRARRSLAQARALRQARLAERGSRPTSKEAILIALAAYMGILRTACNTALPAAALALLLAVIQGVSSETYALQVVYNQKDLGYVANEVVYLSAQESAREHMSLESAAGGAEKSAEASYAITKVTPEQLTDTDTLRDELLAYAPQSMTSACGVYVTDPADEIRELVATIKNETDASAVLESIKTRYAAQMELQTGDTVGFVQKIELVQSFYPAEDERMVDAAGLSALLTGMKEGEKVEYARDDEDSIWSIAHRNGTTEERLLSLNPQYRDAYVHKGDRVVLSQQVDFLQVKVVRTQTRTAPVPFETTSTMSGSMYQGERRTTTKGVPGEDTIVERVTYVNGSRVSAEEVSRTRTKEPVTEKLLLGSKSTRVTRSDGSSYTINPSAQGFVWPVPALKSITSRYGSRGRGWHSGIDISGSGASGKTVVAAKQGRVESANFYSGYGNQIVIDHGNGVKTRYAHLLGNSTSVRVGEYVDIGQPIARVGNTGNSTGPHLHFEVIINGNTQNPSNYVRP